MDDVVDIRTKEEKLANYRYWQSRTPAEHFEETRRLSVEKYGLPKGDLRDGPWRLIRRLPGGGEEVIREWSGPNPMRNTLEHGSDSGGR